MKILLAVDGSSYSRAAADFIASRQTLGKSKPRVHVLNVQLPLPPHPARVVGNAAVRAYYAEEGDKILAAPRKRLEKAGFSPRVQYAVGHPASEISATADKEAADLIVLGSHGRSALKGLLFGSVTTEVLTRTNRAVLMVRAKDKVYPDSLRVGIAGDGSPYGAAALKYVLRHIKLFGAKPRISLIHVVHTYELAGFPSAAGIAPPAFSPAEVRELQDKAFEAAINPLRKLLDPQTRAGVDEVRLIGNPGDQLSAFTKKKLDLLVMGSHGYGAFKAAVMGSVATRVAAQCAVPLLLIRNIGNTAKR